MCEDSKGELSRELPNIRQSKGDVGFSVLKAAIAALPGGSSAIELLELAIMPPLAVRQAEWFDYVVEALRRLEYRIEKFSFSDIAKEDAFLTTFLHATQIALRNHKQEKRQFLRNAILSVALYSSIKEEEQMLFLRYVDELTPSHVNWLKRFWEIVHDEEVESTAFYDIISERMSSEGFQEGDNLFNVYWNDLTNRGLVNLPRGYSEELQELLLSEEMPKYFGISDLGERFLEFIKTPVELNEIPKGNESVSEKK